MRNRIYSDIIATRIKEILDLHLSDDIKNISVGDFTLLPSPDDKLFNEYLPALIISPIDVENETSNVVRESMSQLYSFELFYITPYTFTVFEEVPLGAQHRSKDIANLLLEHRTLDSFSVEQSDEELGGVVMSSDVSRIQYSNAETDLFKALSIPSYIIKIHYSVLFRTLQAR